MKHLSYELTGNQAIVHNFRISKLLDLACDTKNHLGRKTINALDLGCGRGELLRGLRDLGYITYGLDKDPECVRLSSKYGETFEGDIVDAAEIFGNTPFDLVISSHSLEHTENPLAALQVIRNLMREYLILAVPNVYFSVSVLKMLVMRRITTTNQGHLYEWDPANFKNLLETHAKLNIVSWHSDWVKLVPTRFLRSFLNKIGGLKPLECKLGVRLFPQMSESLIALCRKFQ